ncbi:MAG: hypothetical protein HZA31_06720 [Opitutae bacterium]|nr:hypothetical protein [Opitutae bacterium]
MKKYTQLFRRLFLGCLGLGGALVLSASDILVDNYSFESTSGGLPTLWTQTFGSGGFSISTTQKYTGANSLLLTDSSTTASVGIESQQIPIAPSTTYGAFVRIYLVSGKATLYLRYYTSTGTLISSGGIFSAPLTAPLNTWTYLKVSGLAPSNAAYARIGLHSNAADTCTAYWDDAFFTAKNQSIGALMSATTIQSVVSSVEVIGGVNTNMIYCVSIGSGSDPSRLMRINADTNTCLGSWQLTGTTSTAGITRAADGKIYIGASITGKVWRFTPPSTLTDLGKPTASNTYVPILCPGEGNRIYGGTYPDCRIFWLEGTTFTPFGPSPLATGNAYVSSIAYDATNNLTYAGTGLGSAQLMRYRNGGGTPANYQCLPSTWVNSYKNIWQVDLEGGKVFVRLSEPDTGAPSSSREVVLDITQSGSTVTVVEDANFDIGSRTVSPMRNIGGSNKVFFVRGSLLQTYDIAAKTTASTGINLGMTPIDMWFATLQDQTNYPGETLIGITNGNGGLICFRYNLQTGTATTGIMISATPKVGANFTTMKSGVGNKLYAGSEIGSGGFGIYTPFRSDQNQNLFPMSQVEGLTQCGNLMYLGTYPAAKIREYDPAAAWGANNPIMVLDLAAGGWTQERPFGMTTDGSKVYIGTVPGAGLFGGALAIFDPANPGSPFVWQDLVDDYSLVALAYDPKGYIWAGCTVAGGKNTTPTNTTAKLLRYKISDSTRMIYTFPTAGVDGISGLMVGPGTTGTTSKIWGFAEGRLFVFDSASATWEYNTDVYPAITSSWYRDAHFQDIGDGYVYATVGKYFLRIAVSNKAVTTLYIDPNDSRCTGLSQDEFKNLYYGAGSELKRWMP